MGLREGREIFVGSLGSEVVVRVLVLQHVLHPEGQVVTDCLEFEIVALPQGAQLSQLLKMLFI